MKPFFTSIVALLLASQANAQFGGFGGYGGFSNGDGDNGNGVGSNSNGNPFGDASFFQSFFSRGMKILIAHAVLSSVAFVALFPIGSIMIRLSSYRHAWLLHGLFQLFAYAVYIAGMGLRIYMASNLRMLSEAHAKIGIALFVALFVQPILGFVHHAMFKKVGRRTFWSYGHLWLGRSIVTLGIINGGLGLQLATRSGIGAPTQTHIIIYGVVAGVMWLLYVLAAVYGEHKRGKVRKMERRQPPVVYKYEYGTESDGSSGWHRERYGSWFRSRSNSSTNY